MLKPTPRQRQALKTKNRIYKTAMSLFEKYGFDNVTLKHICTACGISTGAFYHYFKGKDDILIEKYRMTDSTFYGDVSSLSGKSYLDKIIEYMGQYAGKAEDDGVAAVTEICHAWLTRRLGFPYGDESAIARGLASLLNNACKAGEIPASLNTKSFALDIVMITRGIVYHWCLMKGDFSAREKTLATLRTYFRGKLSGNFT